MTRKRGCQIGSHACDSYKSQPRTACVFDSADVARQNWQKLQWPTQVSSLRLGSRLNRRMSTAESRSDERALESFMWNVQLIWKYVPISTWLPQCFMRSRELLLPGRSSNGTRIEGRMFPPSSRIKLVVPSRRSYQTSRSIPPAMTPARHYSFVVAPLPASARFIVLRVAS